MDELKLSFLLGVMALPALVSTFTYTYNGQMVLVQPPTIIDVVRNHDIPSYSYYAPLDNYIEPAYPVVS